MIYERFGELPALIESGLVSKRPHLTLPLDIYNYTQAAQFTPVSEWTPAMYDCRGLILSMEGVIIGRPFRKFWNYEQVLDAIPSGEHFTVWEKLDGSLGIACAYDEQLVTATRGSFDSDQARWFAAYMAERHPDFNPGAYTFLFEIVYPENRIVVDYGDTRDVFLIAVHQDDARDRWDVFAGSNRFRKARRFDGVTDFSAIDADERFKGQEGFVVQWDSGYRAKVKLAEYKRLHRIVTQCSTRTIWEMLRAGSDVEELTDRVPPEFEKWVLAQIHSLRVAHAEICEEARYLYASAPPHDTRKDFALWALGHPSTKHLLFRLFDGRDIAGDVWKMVEPKWEKAFAVDTEG